MPGREDLTAELDVAGKLADNSVPAARRAAFARWLLHERWPSLKVSVTVPKAPRRTDRVRVSWANGPSGQLLRQQIDPTVPYLRDRSPTAFDTMRTWQLQTSRTLDLAAFAAVQAVMVETTGKPVRTGRIDMQHIGNHPMPWRDRQSGQMATELLDRLWPGSFQRSSWQCTAEQFERWSRIGVSAAALCDMSGPIELIEGYGTTPRDQAATFARVWEATAAPFETVGLDELAAVS